MESIEDRIRKENLRKSADSYKEQLEMDINQSFQQLENAVKASLIIGGSLLIGYSIYRLFTSPESKKESKREKPKDNFLQPLLRAGSELVASYLLGLAKTKLKEYIEDLHQVNPTENGHTQEPDSQKEGGN